MNGRIRRRAAFVPGVGFWGWLILMVFSVVMTQALRSPASHMLFWFMVLIPPAALLYLLIGALTVRVYANADVTRSVKEQPVTYEISIINGSPLCFPTLEAVISVPFKDGVRCVAQRLVLCLLPLGNYEIRHTAVFRYRGTYEIGADCLYIRDLFHLFRLRRDIDLYHTVLVFPRRLPLTDKLAASVSELPSQVSRRVWGDDPTEIGDVREYRPGDPLKSVHWKLSSKAQDLLIKEYETDQERRVYVLCDYADRRQIVPQPLPEPEAPAIAARRIRLRQTPGTAETAQPLSQREMEKRRRLLGEENDAQEAHSAVQEGTVIRPEYEQEINELCADGVAELCCAAVLRELQAGNTCTLIWYDEREKTAPVRSVRITCAADFESIFTTFATTPDCASEHDLSELALQITDSVNVTIRIVSANLDDGFLTACEAIPAMLGGAGAGCVSELLLFNPEERYQNPAARREHVAACRERLLHSGVSMKEIHAVSGADGQTVLTDMQG